MIVWLIRLAAVLLALDWRQTLRVAREPWRWRELNPLLGEHPSVGSVDVWFGLVSLALAVAWYVGPGAWRLPLLVAFCAAELICVLNNVVRGIRPD